MRGTSISNRKRIGWQLTAAVILGAVPSTSFGLAVLNSPFALPPGLENGVIRIRETTGSGNYLGTGTVINIVPDGKGGNFYCILTADHVVRDPTNGNLAASVAVGFNTNGAMFPFVQNTINNTTLRANAPVDLAVFSVDIPANANVPSVLPAPIIAATTAAGNQIIQAGYGDQATAGTGAPAAAGQDRYAVNPGFGTFLDGTNTIAGTTNGIVGAAIGNGNNYTFNSLDGTFAFTKAAGVIVAGTTYILSGDSGGPTFESNGSGGLGLVGVHSFSAFRSNAGQEFEIPGDQWHDVNANAYSNFIATSCAAVSAPEPGSLCLLAAGGLGLLMRRRSQARV